jgi:hypothetical protein
MHANTSTEEDHIPDPLSPVLSSDFSAAGYFQPATNPQFFRNATCTTVTSRLLKFNPSTRDVRNTMHVDCSLRLDLRPH